VAELAPEELITYANLEFERLTAQKASDVQGKRWGEVTQSAVAADDGQPLSDAIQGDDDFIGAFTINHADGPISVNAWSNVIEDDSGQPIFRLVALAKISTQEREDPGDLEQRIRDKDTLLRELQHRVKNNLQMITALIRLETRNLPDDASGERFDRLAGRVDSLALLYRSLSAEETGGTVDLGIYLSEIASAVMKAHAVEGIRLDLRVDSYPVSINVAMPTGLVVNELLTNSLKHAFRGRDGGTITLHSVVDGNGCRVMIADDGVGIPEGETWPKRGRLGALIAESLKQNANAQLEVASGPDTGTAVTITFSRASAAAQ
jgi:two-component sensor histidine kinase